MLRRKKFQEAILVLMRMIVVALIVMAFCRPFFQDRASLAALAVSARSAKVIVVDLSESISRSSQIETIRKLATDALSGVSQGRDAAALVTFADTPTVEMDLTGDLAQVRSRIASLQIGHGGTSIVDALRKADEILGHTMAGEKEIVLISDLQKTGWSPIKGDWRIPSSTKLTIHALPAPAGGGLVILDSDCPESMIMDNTPRTVSVKVANLAKQDQADIPVTLTLGIAAKKTTLTQKLNLKAGASAAVRFSHVFNSPGDNPGTVHVGPPEAHGPNDTAYFNVRASRAYRSSFSTARRRPIPPPMPDSSSKKLWHRCRIRRSR